MIATIAPYKSGINENWVYFTLSPATQKWYFWNDAEELRVAS